VDADRDAVVDEVLAAQDRPDAYSLYPEAATALQRLRDRGFGLCIVSNFSWALADLTGDLGIGSYCAAVVTSAQIGYRKPHPGIFRAALDATGARPEEVLFVGDTMKDDVRGAAAFGFRSVLVDRRRTGRHDWPSIALLTDLEPMLAGAPSSLPSRPTAP
jgi:putative hydrolase of the HAD superfamily